MNTRHTETLSAFVDGESVDFTQLADALEDAEARGALIDFVKLREAARSDPTSLPLALGQLRQSRAAGRLLRWTAAAAVLLLVFVAGLFTPFPSADDGTAGVQPPPSPARVEKFEPGVDWHPGN
jgi:hypothetical protein